ncbi:hypothetical protein Leryth_022611 [Lithospermum erythrorhizon]|nr:hypothetical protein Leryth_022611 [Lithospermum erythrorhizon]
MATKVKEIWEKIWKKKTMVALALGQFLSLLITSTDFSSSELANRGLLLPPRGVWVTGKRFSIALRIVLNIRHKYL